MSPVNVEDYDAIVAAINKKYATSQIHSGDSQIAYDAISTGSPELDIAMGRGVPQGRWTRFYGGFASTKTMTALAVAGNAQRMGLSVAYYNVEKRYSADFAARLGVDTKKLRVVPGTTIEEIGDKMESLLSVVHLHIIDSCSIAVSEDELTADIREWRPGISARAWGKVFRRLNERFDSDANTTILIDQMRTFGIGKGMTWEDPAGGKVFDHQSSMSVLFKKSSWLFRDKDGFLTDKGTEDKRPGMDEQIQPAGLEIKIRVEKSSVCRPFRTATLHYDLDTVEYDRIYEYVKAAKHYGVVESHGGWYWYYAKKGSDPIKVQGEKGLRKLIGENKILQKTIHKVALEAALQ